MSGDVAITASGLGKRYQLGDSSGADSLRDALASTFSRATMKRAATAVAAFARGDQGDDVNTLWSLRDVSFEIPHGETVGIIGRNGAGKSTLLKILSRITQPTTGRVRIVGRVGSLLEVGTGFHPDLTGRENIFLNGAILGMRRTEIARKFDEIVAFAEVERFLDTQVKHYSSGMYLRLAFAVAAHLEPDILLVDEVLAVGDLEFQRKCLGKMSSVAGEGRTVLFVSHNLGAVRTICRSAMVLDGGRVVRHGNVDDCLAYYVAQTFEEDASRWVRPAGRDTAPISISRIESRIVGRQPALQLHLDVTIETRAAHRPALVTVDVSDAAGVPLFEAMPHLDGFIPDDAATHLVRLVIGLPPLVPGQYFVKVWLATQHTEIVESIDRAIRFEIHDSPRVGRTHAHTADHGFLVAPSTATCEPLA
ncbi:MAG TPA: polysaccharide ABC transporter ATP-binding protein [Gemmatimonadaceae bacterium]|nr:polysaccharide ABC transporter ATP-binding protein [Gemmatimonadaceae bacterium]